MRSRYDQKIDTRGKHLFISNYMRMIRSRVFDDSTDSCCKLLATNVLVQASVGVCISVRMHVTKYTKQIEIADFLPFFSD